MKALLTEAALQHFEVDAYYFCGAPGCDTVYFSLDSRRFATRDIRVAVWQKQPAGRRQVCYCFGENEADIRHEIEQTGASGAMSRVRGHIAAKRCACDIRNPRGTCCLGDVDAAVKRVQAAVQSAVSS